MIYKLNSVNPGAATISSIAALDIQMAGNIIAVSMSIVAKALDALNDFEQLEVSFMSSHTFNVNDTRGSIAMMTISQQFLTNGGGVGNCNHAVSGLFLPVAAGERIHIHKSSLGGGASEYTAYVYVSDDFPVDRLRPKQRLR